MGENCLADSPGKQPAFSRLHSVYTEQAGKLKEIIIKSNEVSFLGTGLLFSWHTHTQAFSTPVRTGYCTSEMQHAGH